MIIHVQRRIPLKRIRICALLLWFFLLPSYTFACMISPTHEYTLIYGVLKVAVGFALLFFSCRLYFRGNSLVHKLFYLLAAVVFIGSIYSIVFRYGLYSNPSCGTEYGQLTGTFFLFALIVSLLVTIIFFAQRHLENKQK